MNRVMRPALRYHGSKFRLYDWISRYFPQHKVYVEPFGGSASILMQKPYSPIEVYNDLDHQIVNFFRVLRDCTDAFVRTISLTPYSREELTLAYKPTNDPLEQARRFYVRAWQSYSGPSTTWTSGWRFDRSMKRGKRIIEDWNELDRLYAVAERLKHVMLENDDALAVIRRYDSRDTLFYIDPPYFNATIGSKWKGRAYRHWMTDDNYQKMAGTLQHIQGMAIVSGYYHPSYDELFAGWQRIEKKARTNFQSKTVESIWLSPTVTARMSQRALFDYQEQAGK